MTGESFPGAVLIGGGYGSTSLHLGNNASFEILFSTLETTAIGCDRQVPGEGVICRSAPEMILLLGGAQQLAAGGEGRYGAGARVRGHRKEKKLLGPSLIDVRPLKLSVEGGRRLLRVVRGVMASSAG